MSLSSLAPTKIDDALLDDDDDTLDEVADDEVDDEEEVDVMDDDDDLVFFGFNTSVLSKFKKLCVVKCAGTMSAMRSHCAAVDVNDGEATFADRGTVLVVVVVVVVVAVTALSEVGSGEFNTFGSLFFASSSSTLLLRIAFLVLFRFFRCLLM